MNYTSKLCKGAAPRKAPVASELKLAEDRGLTLPLELMVGEPAAVRRLQMARMHVASSTMPEGSIISVGEGLYVASPELCFFQLANRLPLAKLLRLGLEFCGTYTLPANNAAQEDPEMKEKGFKNRPPLTSVERLSSFLARSGGTLNQRYLQSVLRYIANGSASPMESRLLIVLALPYRHGGYGLPLPELDAPVKTGRPTKRSENKKSLSKLNRDEKDYRCDLYWRNNKLAVEYDSDIYHLLPAQKTKDSKKKNYLLSKGIHVISVTRLQMRSVLEVESVAMQLSACLGKQLRHKRSAKWLEKHMQLRRQLGI
ncbi:MAG: endonuclease domain-containing protein [Coriobacteriia bacterium]|nr:endonuclease domain-containing protein [Coriobacteriia bacterium]